MHMTTSESVLKWIFKNESKKSWAVLFFKMEEENCTKASSITYAKTKPKKC